VKGRVDEADTVMITRQEVIASLQKPNQFSLKSLLERAEKPH